MHSYFYDDNYQPEETPDGVEETILNGYVDRDGVSNWDWCKAIVKDEDMPFDIIEYILQNKNEPAIKPLYQKVRWTIESILDKE
jgi:hypothetical protein